MRVFRAATSTGVRGMALAEGDEVISMSMLRHVDADAEERDSLSPSGQRRAPGSRGGGSSDEAPDPDAEVSTTIALSPERTRNCAARRSSC